MVTIIVFVFVINNIAGIEIHWFVESCLHWSKLLFATRKARNWTFQEDSKHLLMYVQDQAAKLWLWLKLQIELMIQ